VSVAAVAIDYERLLKLRLVVARLGEMDNAGWWNTKGLLGSSGSFVLRRGFPNTHSFAQARAVFAVATTRCRELFDAAGYITLWQLPASVEEQFEDRWQTWLDDIERWQTTFEQVAAFRGQDVIGALRALELIDMRDAEAIMQFATPTTEPSLLVAPEGGLRELDDAAITLLAMAFAKSVQGKLAVPYMQLMSAVAR